MFCFSHNVAEQSTFRISGYLRFVNGNMSSAWGVVLSPVLLTSRWEVVLIAYRYIVKDNYSIRETFFFQISFLSSVSEYYKVSLRFVKIIVSNMFNSS